MSNPEIRQITHTEIDSGKWDRCLSGSSLSLVYAQSWYLDLVSPGWNALILGDYEYVMPLTIRRKAGIKFLLQPIFAQQHGIFPEPGLTVQNRFLNYIRDQFSYVAIQLNSLNPAPFPENFVATQRQNFILNQDCGYETMKSRYSKHCRRQIKKAEAEKVFVMKGIPVKEYIDLKNRANDNQLPEKSMKTLKQLIAFGNTSGKGTIYAAYTRDNSLCAAAFFLHSGNRVVYLNAVSNAEGKNTSAMYLIVDQFIREHAEAGITLDFEGSSIPGIARFYQGFGAVLESYFSIKLNRLPAPLRWIIK